MNHIGRNFVFRCMAALLLTGLLSACAQKERVDMLLHNAQIYTVDSAFTVVEALAVHDGKIVATGSSEALLQQYVATELIDANKQFIYPGFIDAHGHFTGYALDAWKIDLTGTRSFEDVIQKLVAGSASVQTEWLYGRGWDHQDWEEKQFPDKHLLDSLFPNRPVLLKRVDGHAALVNEAALQRAGIDEHFTIASGEVILKNGKPTGMLIDKAMEYVDAMIPRPQTNEALPYILDMQRLCLSVGLTGVHDCGISMHEFEMLETLNKDSLLKIKLYVLMSDSMPYYEYWSSRGLYKTPALTMGGFKLYGDGALGSRGACLLHPYHDRAGWNGFLLSAPAHFEDIAARLIQTPFQLCTHAIGDSANRHILHTYAAVLKGKNNRRWRIEHAQVIDSTDIHYFADYSIIPSVQPTHATSDMLWAQDRLGKQRMRYAYAYQPLLQTNGWMPLGTDFPVEDMNPRYTFYASVFRKDARGFPEAGFQPAHALTREEALRGMTIWAARAGFQEQERGSLEVGKSADWVILNTDLMQCAPAEVLQATVLATYINGVRVYGAAP